MPLESGSAPAREPRPGPGAPAGLVAAWNPGLGDVFALFGYVCGRCLRIAAAPGGIPVRLRSAPVRVATSGPLEQP